MRLLYVVLGFRVTTLLLTGGTGFIGAALIDAVLERTDWRIVSLERLYSTNPAHGRFISSNRLARLYHDVCAPFPERLLSEIGEARYIVHAGTEVSGIRSISDPRYSIEASVLGTTNVLEAARSLRPERVIYLSSIEAVGPCARPISLPESAPLRPSNPYAAAKAAGEMLVGGYVRSFLVPGVVVRSVNLFGPRQGTERFVAKVIREMMDKREIVCHVDAKGMPGSRHWLHVDHCVASLMALLVGAEPGETYHVVGPERDNLEMIEMIGARFGKPFKIVKRAAGKTHDQRYSIADTKIRASFEKDFEDKLNETVDWYMRFDGWGRA